MRPTAGIRSALPILALFGLTYGVGPADAAASQPTVRPAAAECQVAFEDPSDTADADRARTACNVARARFAELFGEPAPAARIVLWTHAGYRVATQGSTATAFWPTSRTLEARYGDGNAARAHIADQWRNVLPHEITHALLAAHFFGEGRDSDHAGYGSPFPDWLDEGAAIWAESVGNRRARLEGFRKLPEPMQDLRTILAMPHPATGNAEALAARDGAPIPADEALWAYYPQSFAVVAFIHQAGGAAAVRELARRLVEVPTDTAALVGLPGLPADMDAVTAAWDSWRRTPAADHAADG